MRDEIDARIWNEHGQAFSEDLERLLKSLARATRKIAAVLIRVRTMPKTNS